VTNFVHRRGDFRIQALKGIEIVAAGVKCGNLASAD